MDLRLAIKNSFSIGSLFRHKDPVPSFLCCNIIYVYKCALFNECYTGSTQQWLQCRIAEHLGVSVRTDLTLSNRPYSAIFDHREQKGHPIDKSNFEVVNQMLNKIEIIYNFWNHCIFLKPNQS